MSELEQNIPDDFWQKAFEEAAETPPPRVWDAVERRLDESNGPRILPLWGTGLASSRPWVWGVGVAAALALLLVGWWVMSPESPSRSIAQNRPANQTERMAASPARATEPTTNASEQAVQEQNTDRIAAANKKVKSIDQSSAKRNHSATTAPVFTPTGEFSSQIATLAADKAHPVSRAATASYANEPQLATKLPADSRMSSIAFSTASATSGMRHFDQQGELTVNQLAHLPLHLREPRPINRIVWFRPAELDIEPEMSQLKRESRELWASVSMMPGAFNPSVALRPAQSVMANSFVSNAAPMAQPSVNSRPNFSVAYQAGAGVQLTEHWSVESGIGYLAGHSTVESPTQTQFASIQAVANNPAAAENLYVSVLRQSSTNNLASNSPSSMYGNLAPNDRNVIQNYNAQTRQSLTNDFQYVQVPFQVGYQLRPRKRLGLALLGGLLTNIFVRNTVGDELVVTPGDGIYRPVSWAASMGARFRYRPSRRWSASLAGLYQPTLGSGTRPNAQVRSQPTSAGMSFGLDYHF
ncbi:hypothetical protein HNV11_23290 [Spirosoma taeanense]|uniref:Outer membrane beta-barrel protein n=1 Tax=Spirosoma taeanense TaxID=2735870 RepID=A0A6M5YFJ8_9BACT|nr:hypothetical protein [Spirosoma taeanense]QJW92090.1 hypothetical protein HNV11_23290 [Spirosoma taeanense]